MHRGTSVPINTKVGAFLSGKKKKKNKFDKKVYVYFGAQDNWPHHMPKLCLMFHPTAAPAGQTYTKMSLVKAIEDRTNHRSPQAQRKASP